MKWLFGLLLLINLAFFAFMQWGAVLMNDSQSGQPQALLNAEKIKLQTASPVAQTLASPSAVVHSEAGAVAVSAVGINAGAVPAAVSCLEWGEFSGGEFIRASAALSALHLGDSLVQKQVEHVGGYWVYIPPLKSRVEVDRKILQLKARGVEEYFVIKEAGKWQNSISLGIFKTEDAAQKFLVTLNAKGVVSARAGERMSNLLYTVFELRNLDASMVDKVRALQNQFPGNEMKTVACGG